MGKLIDIDKLKDITEYCILASVPADAENTMEEKWNDWFQTVIDRAQPVEAIPKDQYEARLKADMVAMLTEIQMEIKKKSYYDTTIIGDYEDEVRIDLVELDDVNEIIQQKINSIKAESGG